jgi:hypothetical protein
MNHRRLIGSILTLALLAGSVFVPLARAACAMATAKTASCSSCTGAPWSRGAAVSMDRSCCAAPSSASDREPATLGSDRGDHRSSDSCPLLSPEASGSVRAGIAATPSHPTRLPGSSPPPLRSTVLRI